MKRGTIINNQDLSQIQAINEKVSAYLTMQNSAGKRIAVWGAGRKGIEFLTKFDKDCHYIDFVFDKDENKYGKKLPTGHRVVDYRENEADIVILSSGAFYWETRRTLNLLPWKSQLINLDDVIYGPLSFEELDRGVDLQKVRSSVIAAVVILYHPDVKTVENILSYANAVDKLYLYDNSETSNERLFAPLSNVASCKYLFAGGINRGIGAAINEAAEIALKESIDWLFTFDQDSRADAEMVPKMRKYIESIDYRDCVGIVAPRIVSPIDTRPDDSYIQEEPYIMYVSTVIQSGALHNLSAFKKVGGYDERLFIDYVDFDYCVRCRLAGFVIAKIPGAAIYHQEDSPFEVQEINGSKRFMGKYSPQRYYYQCRNMLYCKERYREIAPDFSAQCERGLGILYKQLESDRNYEENVVAVRKAENDYRELLTDYL